MIKKINREVSGEKRREDCVAGDRVMFTGGYFKNSAGKQYESSPTDAFTIGRKYILRDKYSPKGYGSSYDKDKNHIRGSFNFMRDDRGSTMNGWAAALFEPV